jgi:glycosyltransferase involved in cell wall biosynthesis
VTRPEVTVVIPTRDRADLLCTAALPSALSQVDVEVEVVVVDDGSADGTVRRIEEVGDPRIRVLAQPQSIGVAAARNAGIAAARGVWIAFLDDDDLWAPRKLRTQLERAAAVRASFAYCSVVVVMEDVTPTELVAAPPAETLATQLLRWNSLPAGSSNMLVSADLLDRVGGFDPGLGYLADWDLWIRLALAGTPAACEDVLVAYVRHPGRMRLSGRAAVKELERLRARHAGAGFRPDAGRFLTWVAAEHRRGGRRGEAAGAYARAAFRYGQPRQLARVATTALDWRGSGLRNLLGRGPAPAPRVATPDWLRRT